jgi:hypothetical protein
MDPDARSRVDQAVPKPEAAEALSEAEKRALEKSGEIEHAHGAKRERLAEEAQEET